MRFWSVRRSAHKGGVARFHTHKERTDTYISEEIRRNGVWEPLETELISRLAPMFPRFLDIGANIGWHTSVARRFSGARTQIFAFEPDPANFALLKRNTASMWPWPRTVLIQSAISDRVGHAELHLSLSNQGDHRLYASEEPRDRIGVEVTTLDAFFDKKQMPPFLLKSDTQGSEPRVLRGGQTVLGGAIASSVLLIELWPYGMETADEDAGDFLSYLSTLPLEPHIIDNAALKLWPTSWDALGSRVKADLAPHTGTFVDLCLLPPVPAIGNALSDLIG